MKLVVIVLKRGTGIRIAETSLHDIFGSIETFLPPIVEEVTCVLCVPVSCFRKAVSPLE